jgi:hypothetical protein
MKQFLYVLLALGVMLAVSTGCGRQSKSGQSGSRLSYAEFLQSFPKLTLPYSYTGDSLLQSLKDSLRLDRDLLGSFIPDSIWFPEGKKGSAAAVYPIGMQREGAVSLVLVESVAGRSRSAYLLVYGPHDTIVSSRKIAAITAQRGHTFTFELDDSYLLRIHERKELADGQVIHREQVYGVNSDGSQTLIMTNSNQPASANAFVNPVENLPRKGRYSGDYMAGPADLVAIRDGEHTGEFRFFIHLNKHNGDCTGALDGTGAFTGSNTGEFHEEDGPCAVRFSFSSSTVTITETGGCGAYRGIGCYFNGTYTHQKAKTKGK